MVLVVDPALGVAETRECGAAVASLASCLPDGAWLRASSRNGSLHDGPVPRDAGLIVEAIALALETRRRARLTLLAETPEWARAALAGSAGPACVVFASDLGSGIAEAGARHAFLGAAASLVRAPSVSSLAFLGTRRMDLRWVGSAVGLVGTRFRVFRAPDDDLSDLAGGLLR